MGLMAAEAAAHILVVLEQAVKVMPAAQVIQIPQLIIQQVAAAAQVPQVAMLRHSRVVMAAMVLAIQLLEVL